MDDVLLVTGNISDRSCMGMNREQDILMWEILQSSGATGNNRRPERQNKFKGQKQDSLKYTQPLVKD